MKNLLEVRMARNIVTLASWRLRRTRGLLAVIALGVIAAVTLVCMVPLYSEVAMTAGLRAALNVSPSSAALFVQIPSYSLPPAVIASAGQQIDREFKRRLGAYIEPQEFFVQTGDYPRDIAVRGQGRQPAFQTTADEVRFYGAPMAQARSHFVVLQGHLPEDNASGKPGSSDLETAISLYSAQLLHAHLGDVLYVPIGFQSTEQIGPFQSQIVLALHIVGIFAAPNDSYFHGEHFMPIRKAPPREPGEIYPVLVSNTAFIVRVNAHLRPGVVLADPVNFNWYYAFNVSYVGINDLNPLLKDINAVQLDTTNSLNFNFDQGEFKPLYTQVGLPSDVLQQYSNHVAIVQIPMYCLLLLVFGLALFFMGMMVELLVERQQDAIALLRSRGASRRQIAAALAIQALGLAVLAIVVAPLLASLAVPLLVSDTLPRAEQGALNVLPMGAVQVAFAVGWYALAAAAVIFIALVLAIVRATRLDALSLRREASRPISRLFWLHLDMLAAIIMLACYGVSLYLTGAGINNAQLRLLLLSPLTLLGTVCLLLAALLFFLRLFPRLLHWGTQLASRSRAAVPLLALAQMARVPRRSLRMTLLLALATALVIFTLIFSASQSQRALDIAAYQAGADFSGSFNDSLLPLSQQQATYSAIPGVASVALGYNATLYAGTNASAFPIDFRAVDAAAFARTAIWTAQDSSQSLNSLMALLLVQRASAPARDGVPAIADAATWSALNLSPGKSFTLNTDSYGTAPLRFVAVAEVQHIPTISDSLISTDSNTAISSGGVLVDYQSYASVLARDYNGQLTPLNYVWLRSYNDAASIASVRNALSSANLQTLYDRRAIIASLSGEPLSLTLSAALALGTSLAILLIILGNLIASWLNARSRLTGFAILRALGSAPRQLASLLTLEQTIIYATAFILGILCGAILAKLTLPTLIFTSVTTTSTGTGTGSDLSSAQFYLLQNVPPIQIIVPPALAPILALLIATCMLAIAMMVRIVSRPSLSQALRLSED